MTRGIFSGIRRCRYVTPAFVLFIIGYFMPLPLVSEYVYTRTLYEEAAAENVTLTPSDRLIPCSNDTSSPEFEVQMKAQSKASLILMGNTLCSSLPTMLTVLFWGPLSDKWGRKPIILIAYVGGMAQIVVDFLVIVYDWSPYMFYIGNAIQGASGGIMSMFGAASSYITDVSTKEDRALRMYIMQGSFYISIGLVMMAVGQWATAVKSFSQPFMGAFSFVSLGLLYTVFVMPESKSNRDNGGANDGKDSINNDPRDNGQNDHVSVNSDPSEKENLCPSSPSSSGCSSFLKPFFRTASAFRHDGNRKWNWRLILPTCVFFFSFCADVGGRQVQSLFEENLPFCWDADWLGMVSMVKILASCVFSVSALLLLRKCKANVGDFPLIAICLILSIAHHVIYAVSVQDWHLYVGLAVNIFSLTFPLLRTAVSKECSSDNIGAVFAGLSFMETAANLIGGVAFAPLYSATIYFFPGFSFLIMALLEAFALCLLFPLMISRFWKDHIVKADFERL